MTSFLKNSFFILIFVMNLSTLLVYAQEEVIEFKKTPLGVIITSESPQVWYKNGMFWFGCWSGYCMPLTYLITLGLNLVDISHPVVKEKLQPFADGASVGVAVAVASFALTLITLPMRNQTNYNVHYSS